jgi:proteasome component ECM29
MFKITLSWVHGRKIFYTKMPLLIRLPLQTILTKRFLTVFLFAQCIRHIDYEALEKMTPAVLDLMKQSVNLGTKIACAHFLCLISVHIGKEMTPMVGKYLSSCFTGLSDRNSTVRKYNASAIGHLVGIAKVVRKSFCKD